MSQQRSQHFDAIIQQLDAPTSNVRKMVDYLLGNKWELIDAATANALMYQLPFFETFFRCVFATTDLTSGSLLFWTEIISSPLGLTLKIITAVFEADCMIYLTARQ